MGVRRKFFVMATMPETTSERPAPPQRTIWIGLVLIVVILSLSFWQTRRNTMNLPELGQVAPFTLTNQLGQVVTEANLLGHVWLADIIFTRCPGPCARMTRQMAEVQRALPAESTARLISLTSDPSFDTSEVLAKYGTRFGASSSRWQFLTGTKAEIANLAIASLKLTAVEKAEQERTSPEDLFIHSTMFVLVDKKGRLRGFHDERGFIRAGFETGGDDVVWSDVLPKMIKAMEQLEREE